MLAFWLGAVRRPWKPTPLDLWYWRWGFIPCYVLVGVIASLMFGSR
jgi:hypothetical protein